MRPRARGTDLCPLGYQGCSSVFRISGSHSPQEGCWRGRGACPHFWAHPDPPWWRRCCVTARAARVWVNCGVNLPMFGPVLEIILWQTAEGTDLRSLYLHWDSWCQPWKYIHVKKKKYICVTRVIAVFLGTRWIQPLLCPAGDAFDIMSIFWLQPPGCMKPQLNPPLLSRKTQFAVQVFAWGQDSAVGSTPRRGRECRRSSQLCC